MLSVSQYDGNVFHLKIYAPREPQDENEFFTFLDSLLDGKMFSLIIEIDGEKSFSHEAKRNLGIWFKGNQLILKQRCLGIIRIRNSHVVTARDEAMKRAMPCNYQIASSLDMALQYLV